MGPALGVNLAEFEFPGYFNFFICKKRCTLVVDSEDAERNIRRVFSETLLGPAQFRRTVNPIPYEEEDFAPEFPREAIPNFERELRHFRTWGDKELVLETLLNFRHFDVPGDSGVHENLGIPPPIKEDDGEDDDAEKDENTAECLVSEHVRDVDNPAKSNWTYSQARWIGELHFGCSCMTTA